MGCGHGEPILPICCSSKSFQACIVNIFKKIGRFDKIASGYQEEDPGAYLEQQRPYLAPSEV